MEKSEILEILRINKTIEVKFIIDIIEGIIDSDEYDDFKSYLDIYEIINKCFRSKQKFKRRQCKGEVNDFHNLSVVLARSDFNELSCIVLEYAIKFYPNSINLLSDYIEYGIRCNELDKCNQMYNRLCTIPKKQWNWRAYDFSIDYLIFNYENYMIDTVEEILTLTNMFVKAFPNDERSHLARANFYNIINNKIKEEECLKNAIATIKVAPICALKLAQIFFDNGKYDEAKSILSNRNIFSLHTMSSKDIGNMYLLSSLCGMAAFYLLPKNDNNIVSEIYYDYKAAEKTDIRSSNAFKNLDVLIEIFSDINNVDLYY